MCTNLMLWVGAIQPPFAQNKCSALSVSEVGLSRMQLVFIRYARLRLSGGYVKFGWSNRLILPVLLQNISDRVILVGLSRMFIAFVLRG